MVIDNGAWIYHFASKKAAWARMTYEGRVHYLAMNRAARRCLLSQKFQNRMKKLGIKISLEEMAVA